MIKIVRGHEDEPMSTYENAYSIAELIRLGLNDYSSAKVQGTDTTGIYKNLEILKGMNDSQQAIHNILLNRFTGYFVESTSLTGVDSVFTLPSDYGSMIQFRDEDNRVVYPKDIKDLPIQNSNGSKNRYYRKNNTLVLTISGVTDTYTLWYKRKPRDLHWGQAGSRSQDEAIQLTTTYAKKIDDYYNGMTIENVTRNWVDEVTDYAASTVIATISERAVKDDWYGIVSDLPEMFHGFIARKAILMIKSHPLSKNKPTANDFGQYDDDFNEAISAYSASEDVSSEDIWRQDGANFGGGVEIPGHGIVY